MSTDNKAKNVWWLYQARRVNTQTNAGGGALATRIAMPAGQVGRLVSIFFKGSASVTSDSFVDVLDEDDNQIAWFASKAGAANVDFNLPTIGTVATASGNCTDSRGYMLGPGMVLRFRSSVAIQNETLTVGVALLLSAASAPTWATTGSAGTPSLAASTISTLNTMQAVLI